MALTLPLTLTRTLGPQAKTKKEDTALRFAASKGHASTVELLLQSGADAAAVNLNGVTPLESARLAKSDETIRLLEPK